MKKSFLMIAVLLMFGQASFADVVLKDNVSKEGKIVFAVSGLIFLDQNGKDEVFTREVSDDFFGDTIFYKTKLFTSKTEEISCRIKQISKTNVKFYTQDNKLNKISKLRVKNIKVTVM